MISVHLADVRRVTVKPEAGYACVVLHVGAYDRVSITVAGVIQARIIAEAINAGLRDPDAPIFSKRPGGA